MRRAISIISLILCIFVVLSCFTACGQKQQIVESEVWIEEDGGEKEDENKEGKEEGNTNTQSQGGNNGGGNNGGTTTVKDGKYDLGGATVTIGIFDNTYQPNAGEWDEKHKKKLVTEIQKKFNCKIKWKNVNDSMQYYKTFVTATAAGTKYADIVVLPGDQGFPNAIAQGLILPLDNYMTGFDDVVKFSKNVDSVLKVNGKHYFLQASGGGVDRGLFFNEKVLEACGVKKTPHDLYDENNWNWDTFRDIAIACTKKVGATQYYGLASVEMRCWFQSNNGALYKTAADGTQTFNMDSKECLEAIQFVYNLYNNDKVIQKTGGDAAFTSGYVAMATEAAYVYFNTDFKFVDMPKGYSALNMDYVGNSTNAHIWGIPVTAIDKNKSDTENTNKVKALLAIWNYYFDPTYSWRQSDAEYIESCFNDEKSVEIAVKRSNRLLATSNRYWMTYYEWTYKNVVWGNFGVDTQTAPAAYIASIKQKASNEIDSTWAKIKSQK